MFSPLSLERMFQAPPPATAADGSGTNSIMGILWQNNDEASEGQTLKMLLSNGSNPPSAASGANIQRVQSPAVDSKDDSSMISPASPPSNAAILSAPGDQESRELEPMYPLTEPEASAVSSHSYANNTRRLPPIPQQHVRPNSRASMASAHSAGPPPTRSRQHGQSYDKHEISEKIMEGSVRPSSRNSVVASGPQPNNGRSTASMEYASQPLRQQNDMSLRHEVLDKAARQSQPATPFDAHIPIPANRTRRGSNSPRPQSMVQTTLYNPTVDSGYSYASEDDNMITVLPGDNRAYPYTSERWDLSPQSMAPVGQGEPQPQSYNSPRMQHMERPSAGGGGLVQSASTNNLPTIGSSASRGRGNLKHVDYPGVPSQVRKSSDSSAQLLTPRDFNGPLPTRVGNMVLDKEIGEWVHISNKTPVSSSQNGSPATDNNDNNRQEQETPNQQQPSVSQSGPKSTRSSISMQSRASAFPHPLPTEKPGRRADNDGSPTGYAIGLISPVENQRKIVREMTERKTTVPRRANSMMTRRHNHPKQIEDEALGSIVQRLMTPATSPNGCMELDLTGSGIRNLAGLAHITSCLETICLAGNKLQGLFGLPTGLVNLRAPSNWIRFSAAAQPRFLFARELPHLEEVDLSFNEISDISVFSGLRHLRLLELNRNRIDSLNGLRGCRRLVRLGLRDNIVSSFDMDASESPMLSSLDMYNNRLQVLPASLDGFGQLAKANFVKNDLERVELHGGPVEALRELRLSENPLLLRSNGGMLDIRGWKQKFPALKTLYLDICNVRTMLSQQSSGSVDEESMEIGPASWSSLFNLSLRGNALQPSLALDFFSLGHLKNLYAPDTQMVLPQALPPLYYMLQLVLCNAGLTHLPSNLGSAMPQLRLLDVSNNPDLEDFAPILQLAGSLEILKCRTVGFGGSTAGTFPDPDDGTASYSGSLGRSHQRNSGNVASGVDGRAVLKWLARLQRLRRLDLRFNRFTATIYAPPPVASPTSANPSIGSGMDAVLSPQMSSHSVVGGNASTDNLGVLSPSSAILSGGSNSSGLLSYRIDEEAWRKHDNAYMTSLRLNRQTKLMQQREDYWATAASLFSNLEELDGIKVSAQMK